MYIGMVCGVKYTFACLYDVRKRDTCSRREGEKVQLSYSVYTYLTTHVRIYIYTVRVCVIVHVQCTCIFTHVIHVHVYIVHVM